jgi:acetyltransferase EpsM
MQHEAWKLMARLPSKHAQPVPRSGGKMDESARRALIIVCAGGQASELASYVRTLQANGVDVFIEGYVDEHRFEPTFEDSSVIGGIDQFGMYLDEHRDRQFYYVTAVGDNHARANIVWRIGRLGAPNLKPWTVHHPAAVIGDAVEIGDGTCIGPGAVVTTNVTIGEHCILNVNSSVSHDAVLASYVNVGPGALISGSATIGEGCSIGAGATVVKYVRVGEWSVIAPGAVVTDDVPAHVTVDGAPARIVQRHSRKGRLPSLIG